MVGVALAAMERGEGLIKEREKEVGLRGEQERRKALILVTSAVACFLNFISHICNYYSQKPPILASTDTLSHSLASSSKECTLSRGVWPGYEATHSHEMKVFLSIAT